MKLPRLGDIDPAHLSVRPFVCLLAGFALFFVSGWFVVMELGGRWGWAGIVLGSVLIVAGGLASAREKQDEEDSEEGA